MSDGYADKYRGYCFTLNNYTQQEYDDIVNKLKYDYLVIGKEVGESGTPHLQGYVYKQSTIRFNSIKKAIKRAHIEPQRGTIDQAADYCQKDKDFREWGERPVGQGKRTDIDIVRDTLRDTGKMREVVAVATSYSSVRMAECILKYNEKSRNFKPVVKWYYGATGTGKSKTAYEELGEDCYTCLSTGKWFEGYDAHENVLIDDMRGDFLKYHELLRLLDRYAMRVECKGGTRQFVAKNIIITSAYHPSEIFSTKEDIGQLLRRIDEIKEFV